MLQNVKLNQTRIWYIKNKKEKPEYFILYKQFRAKK